MKKILVLILIYSISLQASDEEGCTIPFFNQRKSPCKSTKKSNKIITIAPIVIKKTPKKNTIDRKKMERELHNILTEVKEYKNQTEEQKQQLLKELIGMKKEFYQYKLEKSREIKQLRNKLDSNNKKLVKVQKEVKKITKKKKKIIVANIIKTPKRTHKVHKVISKMQPLPVPIYDTPIIETPEITHEVHKVISKMQPLPIPIYDTPWIEITVENNINIYELALKYYGDKQAYKKIYTANQNIIGDDFKIYNGMNLIIPMTTDFEEQGILINQ